MNGAMEVGVTLRNMGPQSQAEWMRQGLLHAEGLGFESVWITDHIAIPPDDAEGSGGRYTDPLTTLSWFAGMTQTIKLGTGVLILPYRPILPTAKAIATLQELSGNRLVLGVGIGWMDAEFKALGLSRADRGRVSDATLEFLRDCFSQDEVTLNDQPFLFKPRPAAPPILVGGRPPHALTRATALADGWLPMVRSPEQLRPDIERYRQLTDAAGRPPGQVTVMTGLGSDMDQAGQLLAEYAALGVTRVVAAVTYQSMDEYCAYLDQLAGIINA